MITDLQLLAVITLRFIGLCVAGFALSAVVAYLFVCATTGNQPKGGSR